MQPRLRAKISKTCVACGAHFMAKTSAAKYCVNESCLRKRDFERYKKGVIEREHKNSKTK